MYQGGNTTQRGPRPIGYMAPVSLIDVILGYMPPRLMDVIPYNVAPDP